MTIDETKDGVTTSDTESESSTPETNGEREELQQINQMAQAAGLTDELTSKAKQSRSEKKARKAMSKLGQYF